VVLEPLCLNVDAARVGIVRSRLAWGGRRGLRQRLRNRPSIKAQLVGYPIEYVPEKPEGMGSRGDAQGENQYTDYNFRFHGLDSLNIFMNLYNLSRKLSTRIFQET
jgi:hypothetical protein